MNSAFANYPVAITIEPVKGGFILSYPVETGTGENARVEYAREVFNSQRKLTVKVKEVLEQFSTTPDDSGKAE